MNRAAEALRGLALASALCASGAHAEAVLSAANIKQLCPVGDRVDVERLASALVTAAAVPPELLDSANTDGVADGAVRYRGLNGAVSEPVWAVRNNRRDPATPPFGRIAPAMTKSAEAASAALAGVIEAELEPLIARLRSGDAPSLSAPFVVRRNGDGNASVYAYSLFDAAPPIYLQCQPPVTSASNPPTHQTTPGGAGNGAAESTWKAADLRLRGGITDLRNFQDLKDAKPATVSYDLDETKDKGVFAFNVVLGAYFERTDGALGIAPFLSLENKNTRDDKDEIKKVAPGLFAVWRPSRIAFIDYAGLEATWINDLKNEAHLVKARLHVDPQIPLGDNGTLFGTALYPFGRPALGKISLAVRPDLTAILDATDVGDAGTNPQLKDIKSYLGVGGDFSTSFYLNGAGVFSNLRLKLGWRQLWLSGAIKQDVLYRRYGSLEYKPPGVEWLGIALTYDEGDNDDTFQPVDTVALKVTFRR